MKTLFTILFSVSVVMLTGASFIQQPQQPPTDKTHQAKTKPFMQAKLGGSQRVLDGLVTENFRLIHDGAQSMKEMSLALQWPKAEDNVYDHYGDEFRRQCDKLMSLSKDKNLEGAHFTYLSMTSTCINCHNYVRGNFRVQRDKDHPQGPVRLIPTEWKGNTFGGVKTTGAFEQSR